MSTPSLIAITAATCPAASKLATLADMVHFVQSCRKNGPAPITYSSVMSGRYPGAPVIFQVSNSDG
jgi:hypothetical protein